MWWPPLRVYRGAGRGALLHFEDMVADESEFFLVRRVRVVPLLVIRQAIAERPVAGNLTVRPEAARGHKRRAEIDNLHKLVPVLAKINEMALLIVFHLLVRAETFFYEVSR